MLILFLALSLGALHFYLLDGLHGWFFGLSGEESTYYSEGYSDKAFRRIKGDMSEEDVLAILGEPLSRHAIPEKVQISWQYSGRRLDSNYRERVVLFERGKVRECISEYYMD